MAQLHAERGPGGASQAHRKEFQLPAHFDPQRRVLEGIGHQQVLLMTASNRIVSFQGFWTFQVAVSTCCVMLFLEIKLDLGLNFSLRSGGRSLFSYSIAMQTNHRRFSQHLHAGGTLIKLYQVPLPLHLKLLNSCQMASVQCAISAWKEIFQCRNSCFNRPF